MDWLAILGWNPEQLEELRFSGFSFLRQGHYQQALLFFEALVILDPKSLYDLQTLGALHLQMNDNDKALSVLERALSLAPQHEPSLLNKAKALLSLHRKEEGLQILQTLYRSKDPLIAGESSALLQSHR